MELSSLNILAEKTHNPRRTDTVKRSRSCDDSSTSWCSAQGFYVEEHGCPSIHTNDSATHSSGVIDLDGLSILHELDVNTDYPVPPPQIKLPRKERKQIVIPRCSTCGRFSATFGECVKCIAKPYSDVSTSSTVFHEPSVHSISTCFEKTEYCASCRRCSTPFHEIKFSKTVKTSISHKKYGCHLFHQDHVSLCDLCIKYRTRDAVTGKTQSTFSVAWPCVFWSNFNKSTCVPSLWSILPPDLCLSWLHGDNMDIPSFKSAINFVSLAVFQDITMNVREFNTLFNDWSSSKLSDTLNKYYFPIVKCPVGCWAFIDKIGTIPFNHYLAFIDRQFTSFQSNSDNFLRGMRSDYAEKEIVFPQDTLCPVVSPTIIFQNGFPSLATCPDHDKKIPHQYCHIPKSPLHRLVSPVTDRFSPAILNTRTMKPFRENFSTASYKMYKVNGSFQGTSTCFISENRRFDIVDNAMLQREHLYVKFRSDVRRILTKLIEQNVVTKEFAEEVWRLSEDTCHDVDPFVDNSNFVPLEYVGFMKKIIALDSDMQNQSWNSSNDLSSNTDLSRSIANTANGSVHDNNDGSGEDNGNEQVDRFWWKQLVFPCVKTLDRTLGAPPNFINTTSKGADFILLISCNSAVFFSNVLDLHIRRKASSTFKLLSCFATVHMKSSRFTKRLHAFASLVDSLTVLGFFQTLPFVKCVSTSDRTQTLNDILDMSQVTESFIFFQSTSSNTRGLQSLPAKLTNDSNVYHLFLLSDDKETVFFKFKHCKLWWKVQSKKIVPTDSERIDTLLRRNCWKACCYEIEASPLNDNEKKQSFLNSHGQCKAICSNHNVLLTVDFPCNEYVCHNDSQCKNVSSWRCPADDCPVAICKKHLNEKITTFQLQAVPGKGKHTLTGASTSSETERNRDKLALLESGKTSKEMAEPTAFPEDYAQTFFEGPTDGGIFSDETLVQATDSGVDPITFRKCEDATAINSNVILNGYCNLLNRPRNPMRFPKKVWRFLQNFVSNCPSDTIPLIYPEAMLFPAVFYFDENNSIFGALPHTLIAPKQLTNRFKFADIEQHIRNRLLNGSLLTACDPKVIAFYFDIFLNLRCNSRDVRFVLSRGLPDINDENTCRIHEPRLKMEEQDSRRLVNELAAAFRDREADFLLTITMNEEFMFGVSPLHNLILRNTKTLTSSEKKSVRESFMILFMLMWERACTYFIQYLLKSPEKPLGTILRIFPRFEFQTTRGNAPHMHIVIWISESKHNPIIRKFVVGSFRELYGELRKLFQSGCLLVSSEEKIDELMQLARAVLTHSCEKSGFRCHKKRDGNGDLVCSSKVYQPAQETFFREIQRPHSEEFWELLTSVNLADKLDRESVSYRTSPALEAGNFNYAADYNEHFSPVVPLLFALLKGSMNCLLCDKIMSAAYLAKYAAGVEERATISISGRSDTTVAVTVKTMKNLKIGKGKFQAKREDELKTSAEKARIIAATECVWHMLNLKYVFPTYEVVHVSTLPLEQRGGVIRRQKSFKRSTRTGVTDSLLFCSIRKTLFMDNKRHFTEFQERCANEHINSKFTIDKVSLYCVRAPELLFVQPIEIYFKYFTWKRLPSQKNISKKLNSSLKKCHWIDAIGNCYQLRQHCVQQFVHFCEEVKSSSCNASYRNFASQYADILKTDKRNIVLVSQEEQNDAVVVFSNVMPRNIPKFLISFLLITGKFETEFDLYKHGTLVDAYYRAGLLPSTSNITDDDLNCLLRQYILNLGIFVPGSNVAHEKNFLDAKQAFYSLRDSISVLHTPTILYSSLQEECSEKVRNYLTQKLEVCYRNVHAQITTALKPTVDEFISASPTEPLHWPLQNVGNSFFTAEQQNCAKAIKNSVDAYCNGTSTLLKHQFVVGMPGSGKTFLMTHVLFYARCCGLNFMVTALSAERSLCFGGSHIHELFALPVSQNLSVSISVEKSLQRLLFDPCRQLMLQLLDILYIEEVGMISAQQFAAMDLILQRIRDVHVPFGGVLVLATGDPKQLPPQSGNQLWVSPVILTSVQMYRLSNCVRMTDAVGQAFLQAISETQIEEDVIQKVLETFSTHCTFTEEVDEVEGFHAIPIFATRAAERKTVEMKIRSLRQRSEYFFEAKCIDEVKSSPIQNWKVSSNITKFLNSKCLEPDILYCYKDAMMRITMNLPQQNVTQGQLCLFSSYDNQQITVAVAPPGVRDLPPKDSTGNFSFDNNGWKHVGLTRVAGFVHSRRGESLRRVQFPLKNFLAMTIHKSMGETIGKVVTRINCQQRDYSLWQREQLYVLVSRVRRLEDITFIGEKSITLSSIAQLLRKRNQWDQYTAELVNTSCNSVAVTLDLSKLSIFRPRKIIIPESTCGYVYIIVSTRANNTFYVGETTNLRRRLHEHNIGIGANFTNNSDFQPWGLLCFVCGFHDNEEFNRAQRKMLEEVIQDSLVENFGLYNLSPSPVDVLNLTEQKVKEFKVTVPSLRLIICGSFLSQPTTS